ncbi:SDR family oxidoreductase [Rhodococcoides kyotonense]|uniref:NAD(P)-dependent dehydrogenase, short-chain alcohol dehydrogenase family n=1 Tax=Rhodococcoides kyotonense TaxID=398843 RepID=A0A239MHK1_9NOCA|nr:SDR family oxidoreductase [Rhodococcus kyotonensis]SNT41980.1 NAD(P)-dependent dehydrogenase, short-chain alcohol dehydrogenase family [Rhodococcus kyotonensis]
MLPSILVASNTNKISAGELSGKTVVLIGGGTGIGYRVAELVTAAGASVVLGGRTEITLTDACAQLGESAAWRTVDTSSSASVTEFFSGIDTVDALFTTAATYVTGPIRDLSEADAQSPFESKFWGQYRVVKAALDVLADDASIVLMSGAASVRPPGAAPAYVAANAAVEGLGRGMAVELAPIRVNTVAPGTIDGHLWSERAQEVRESAFTQYARATTLGRVGTEDEIARAVFYLFTNTYTTGSTLYPDGGYALR